MEYKLAKQLKGAGFPQDIKIGVKYYSPIGHPRLGIPHQQAVTTSLIDHDDKINELCSTDCVKIPSLEELIDACGDDFRLLELVSGKRWECVGVDEFFDTPTEAVAKLYIQLNEKK